MDSFVRIIRRFRGAPAMAILALACAGILTSPVASADAQQVNVSTTILSKNKCKFSSNSAVALNFGAIDPSVSSNVTASVDIGYRCVGSDPVANFTLSSDDGNNASAPGEPRMLRAGGSPANPDDLLPYTLDFPSSGSAPKKSDETFTLTGTITPSAFQNVVAGSFTDTVVLTIQP